MRNYLLILFAFFGFVFLPLFLFKFEKVECVSAGGSSCSPEMNLLLSNFAGKNFFDIYVKVHDLSFVSFVSSCNFEFFPLKKEVLFEVEEKKILVGVESLNGHFFLVDEVGNLVKKTDRPPSVAVVKVEDFNYEVSDKVSDDLFSSFQILSYLYDFYKLERGTVFDDRIEVYIKNGPVLILPREKDYKTILGRAKFLLDSLMADPQKFKLDKSVTYITIDLRYKNPVLR